VYSGAFEAVDRIIFGGIIACLRAFFYPPARGGLFQDRSALMRMYGKVPRFGFEGMSTISGVLARRCIYKWTMVAFLLVTMKRGKQASGR